jgi:hypothetical protein
VTRWSCEVAEVKRIARQVVEALPDDASFSDLEEFLFERAMVEAGRDDIREGRVRTAAELAPWANRGTWDVAVVWSEQSAVAFVEAFQGSHSDSPENARAFEGAVAQAASHARLQPGGGVSLPEMGDPSIREVRIPTPRIRYRLLYEVADGVPRVLWFTSNTTCYRNVRGAR